MTMQRHKDGLTKAPRVDNVKVWSVLCAVVDDDGCRCGPCAPHRGALKAMPDPVDNQ